MNKILKQSRINGTSRTNKTIITNNNVSTRKEWKNYSPFLEKSFYLPESEVKDAIDIAKAIGMGLLDKFKAKKVVLFGSLAKNKMTKNSDIDIAVWNIPNDLFYKAAAFATGYSNKWNVDLVDFSDCKESLKKAILAEGIILFENE
jgi:predicted nucleotidyltransferase